MRPRRLLLLPLAAALLVGTACGRQAATQQDSKAAVESAIRAYLGQRRDLALDKMDIEITRVDFQGDTAEADVVFRVKDGEGEMPMHYTLRRQGDAWVVEPARPAGAHPGTGGAEMPPGHPPVDSSPKPPEKLPRTGQS